MNRFLNRRNIALLHDVIMAAAAFPAAMMLRVGFDLSGYPEGFIVLGSLALAAAGGPAFWLTGLHRGVWRYASLEDLLTIVKAASLTVLIFLPLMFAATRLESTPRSLPVILWLVLIFLLGGSRFFYRMLKDGFLSLDPSRDNDARTAVLLAGDGGEAERFLRVLQADPQAPYRAVGIIADSPRRIGRRIHGVEVLNTLDRLETAVDDLRRCGRPPSRLVLTRENLPGETVRALLSRADALGLALARLPRATELHSDGPAQGSVELHPVAVEDLLGRPRTVLDAEPVKRLITERRLLVTGAGGTIGGELVRQIAAFNPAAITLFDLNEHNLYQIDRALAASAPDLPRKARLGDIRDQGRIESILSEARPQIVFHAAALKHVPLVEANPLEGILTNTIGTRRLADACAKAGVEVMVQISTDKAVRPANVMGATKRLAESYCQALDRDAKARGSTRLTTVRFGNVLASTGSVVPLFQEQIRRGGPVTVTHPEMTRYFMTVREAVELVLQAGALGGGEEGTIFVLDMGQPMRILDLARQMIRLSGLVPDRDIAIEITGPRPGEKISENLFHEAENLRDTALAGIRRAAPRPADRAVLARALDDLEAAAQSGERDRALTLLANLVPDYDPGAALPHNTIRPVAAS